MGREPRSPILLRVIALQKNHLVTLETREIRPAVASIIGETIDLADLVAVNEVGGKKVLGCDRLRVTNSQRLGFTPSPHSPPTIYFPTPLTHSPLPLAS